MTTVYEKAPLAFGTNTNIRLIQLLSSSVTCAGQQPEIKCKFHILPLTRDVTYTAISYMWGLDEATVDIELDEARFAVRPNLSQLLLTLSRSKSCPDLLWVDAICINQRSESERTHQVRLMGQIYSQAAGVIVWLGHGDMDISNAIDHVETTPMLDQRDGTNLTPHFAFLRELTRVITYGETGSLGFCEAHICLLTFIVLTEHKYDKHEYPRLPWEPWDPLNHESPSTLKYKGIVDWINTSMASLKNKSWADTSFSSLVETDLKYESWAHPTYKSWARSTYKSWSQSTYTSSARSIFNDDSIRQLLVDYFVGINQAHQLLALCTHPYWSRVWIVQEIFLAKNVCVQHGDSRLDNIYKLYSRIRSISTWVKPKAPRTRSKAYKYLNKIPESPAARLLAKRRMWQTLGRRRFVIPWDSGSGMLKCADVRDRVYAMSALMDPKLAVVPDYSKSASELFEPILEEHLSRNDTFSGPIWNIQSMLELDNEDTVVQRAKQHGSPEWISTGTLATYARNETRSDASIESSRATASSFHAIPEEEFPLARIHVSWSERERRRRLREERLGKSLDTPRNMDLSNR